MPSDKGFLNMPQGWRPDNSQVKPGPDILGDKHIIVNAPPPKEQREIASSEEYVEYFHDGYTDPKNRNVTYDITASPLDNQLRTAPAAYAPFIKDHGYIDLSLPVDQHTNPTLNTIYDVEAAHARKEPSQSRPVADHFQNNEPAGNFGVQNGAYDENGPYAPSAPIAGAYDDGDPHNSGGSGDENFVVSSPMINAYDDDWFYKEDEPEQADADGDDAKAAKANPTDEVVAPFHNENSAFAQKPQPRGVDIYRFDKMRGYVDNMADDRTTGALRKMNATDQDIDDRQKMRMENARRSAHRQNALARRVGSSKTNQADGNNIEKDSVVSLLNDENARETVVTRRAFFDKEYEKMGYPDKTGDMTKKFEEGINKRAFRQHERYNRVTSDVVDARITLAEMKDLWKNREDLKEPTQEEAARQALEMAFLKTVGEQAIMATAAHKDAQKLKDDVYNDLWKKADDKAETPRAAFRLKDADRHAQMRERIAGAFDKQEENIDNMQILSDEAIEAGVKDLGYWMNKPGSKLPDDFEAYYHILQAMSTDKRVVDGPSFSEEQFNTLADQFRGVCRAHNEQVRATNAARAKRREKNEAAGSFAELKMAMSTKSNIESERTKDASERALAEIKEKFKLSIGGYLKLKAAWVFQKMDWKWVQKSRSRLENQKSEYTRLYQQYREYTYDDTDLHDIKKQNYDSAKKWVMERYDYDKHVIHPNPKNPNARISADSVAFQELFDPEHFFAVAAEYHDNPQGFLDLIHGQVADALGVDFEKRVSTDTKEGQELTARRQLVNAVAEGLFEGTMDALYKRGDDQLSARMTAAKTLNADHYVQMSGAKCAIVSDTCWNDVNIALNNVYNVEHRDQLIGAHQRDAETSLDRIEDDLMESQLTGGVFKGAGGARFGHEEQIIVLPLGDEKSAPRRAVVEQNLAVARAETEAAKHVTNMVVDVIGAPNSYGSIASVTTKLDNMLTRDGARRYSNNPFETGASRDAAFDEIRNELGLARKQVMELVFDRRKIEMAGYDGQVDGLNDRQVGVLGQMIDDLEVRLTKEEAMHNAVEKFHKALSEVKTASDLDDNKAVGSKLLELEKEVAGYAMDLRDLAERSKVADGAIMDRQLTKTQQEMIANRQAVGSILKELENTKANLADITQRVKEDKNYSGEQAMKDGTNNVRAFEKLLQKHKAIVAEYSDELANQFDGKAEEVAAEYDKLFAAVCDYDLAGNTFSPEARATIRRMEDAQVLDARTIAGLKQLSSQQERKGLDNIAKGQVDNNARDLESFDNTLKGLGGDYHTAEQRTALRVAAEIILPGSKDAQLHFKLRMNTAAGQRGVLNQTLKHEHYAFDVYSRVYSNVDDINEAAELHVEQQAEKVGAHATHAKGTSQVAHDDYSNVHSEPEVSDDEDDDTVQTAALAKSVPQKPLKPKIDGIDLLKDSAMRLGTHDLIKARADVARAAGYDGDWFQDGVNTLEKLYNKGKSNVIGDKEVPPSTAEMENAMAVLELLENMPTTEAESSEVQQQMVNDKVAFSATNLKLALGIDSELDMNDPEAVKAKATEALTNSSNKEAIEDLQKSHAAVTDLLITQQAIATTVRTAMYEPLQEFAQHLTHENVDTTKPDEVVNYIKGPKFKRQRETLRNVAAFIDLKERRDRKVFSDQFDINSDSYMSAGKQMVDLAKDVRYFNPQTMKASTKFWADVKDWLKMGNVPLDIEDDHDYEPDAVQRVKDGYAKSIDEGLSQIKAEQRASDIAMMMSLKGKGDIGREYASVEAHLNMLAFLEESNEDIRDFMDNLGAQYNSLLTDVQQLQSDRLVQLAILESLQGDDPKLDNGTIDRARQLLVSWGHAGAIDKYVENHADEMTAMRAGGAEQGGVLDAWRQNSKGLPKEIQERMTQLNDAILRYEALLKESGKSIASLAKTDSYEKAKAKLAPTTNGILKERLEDRPNAEEQFATIFQYDKGYGRADENPLSKKSFANQKQWREAGGETEAEMKSMGAGQLLPHIRQTMAAVGDQLIAEDVEQVKGYSDEERQADKSWNDQNVETLRRMEQLDALVHETQVRKDLFGWKPSQETKDKINELRTALRDDATRLEPESKNGRRHRYRRIGGGHRHIGYEQRKSSVSTFLNQMDNALYSTIQQMRAVPEWMRT